MATKRIKDLTNTATSVASDSYLAIDGTSNGTEKITRDNFRQDTANAFVAAPGTYNLAPLSGGAVEVAKGGTGSTTAAGARTNLEVNSKDEDAQANALKTTAPALYFNGSSSVVTVADDDKFSFTDSVNDLPFSVGAFVKMTDASNFCIVSKYGAGGSQEWVAYVTGSDKLSFWIRDASSNTVLLTQNATITSYEGSWVHIAFTYAGAGPSAASGNAFTSAGNGMSVFINGVDVTSDFTVTNNASYSGMSNTSQAVRLGAYGSTVFSKGSIRDVKIFNRELTASEIAELARGNDLGFVDEWGDNVARNTGTFTNTVSPSSQFGTITGASANGFTAAYNPANSTNRIGSLLSAPTLSRKRYRVTFDADTGGQTVQVWTMAGDSLGGQHQIASFNSVTPTRYTYEFFENSINGGDRIGFLISSPSAGSLVVSNLRFTAIGTLADFRAENYDPDSLTLADISDNAFIGTNNGATFVGNGLPPHAATRQQLAETNALKTTAPALYFNGSSSVVTVADDDKLTFSSLTEFGKTTAGTWSPEDNTPALTDGTGTLNDHYKIDAAGTVAQGGSTLSIINGASVTAGQVVYYDGSVWRVKDCDDLPFTISSWVKTDGTETFYPVAKYGTSNSVREWQLRVSAGTDVRLLLEDGSGNTASATASSATTASTWVHVTATYSGTSGGVFTSAADGISIYVNGSPVSVSASTSASYGGMQNTNQSVYSARISNTYTPGSLRDVKIFNRELTSTEIAQLARGNDLGFVDEWGGALGAVYTSDFSNPDVGGDEDLDGVTATAGAVDGNIDSVGGQDDNLRFTADNTLGTHFVRKSIAGITLKRHRVLFDYYIPSGQSNIDGLRVRDSSTGVYTDYSSPTLGQWNRGELEYIPTSTSLRFYALDGGAASFQDAGGDDVFYIRNVTVTEIGTLADFRAERYDTSTNKLYDISDNAFVGTGTSVSLTGREVPVYETGTWTPSVSFGGGSTGVATSIASGFFTRIGNLCHVSCNLTLTSKGSDTGTAVITGLPFTAGSVSNQNGSIRAVYAANMAGLTSGIEGRTTGSSTDVTLQDWGAAGIAVLDDTNFTNTTSIRLGGWYQIQ